MLFCFGFGWGQQLHYNLLQLPMISRTRLTSVLCSFSLIVTHILKLKKSSATHQDARVYNYYLGFCLLWDVFHGALLSFIAKLTFVSGIGRVGAKNGSVCLLSQKPGRHVSSTRVGSGLLLLPSLDFGLDRLDRMRCVSCCYLGDTLAQ